MAIASPALVAQAIGAATVAFRSWRQVDPDDRIAQVQRAIGGATAGNGDRAHLLTRELGKVIADARGELAFAFAFAFAFALAVADGPIASRLARDVVVDDDEGRLVTIAEPFGVIAAVTPWNVPVILASLEVVPALMTGNTMVLKPSPLAPLAVTQFLSEVATGLSAGVLNIVNGGGDVGAALVGDERVAKVSFTGGLATARHIAALAARQVTPTVMELGGNDAAVFLPDAPFDRDTMQRAVFGAFLSSGQDCMAIKRILVPNSRRQEFVEEFVAAAARVLRVGDPLDPDSAMGPVVTRADQRRIEALVASAQEVGASVHSLGVLAPAEGQEDGYWVQPTLVDGLSDDHPLVRDEQFGPTVPLLTYRSVEEAIARANSVDQTLASSVWSADEERAWSVARRLDVGFTFINCHNRVGISLRATFGGRGVSGHGREFGVAEYLQTHSVNYPNAIRRNEALGNAYPVPSAVV